MGNLGMLLGVFSKFLVGAGDLAAGSSGLSSMTHHK